MRSTLLWRLRSLPPPIPSQTASILPTLHVLPSSALDPLGRPIIILKVLELAQLRVADKREQERILEHTLQLLDTLRLHLNNLTTRGRTKPENLSSKIPTLQYTLILDVSNVSMRTIVRQIVPSRKFSC
jgi:hypothetical protein